MLFGIMRSSFQSVFYWKIEMVVYLRLRKRNAYGIMLIV
uniref:Uncharacterized protein n=1 Tax=Setaria italica TaxID=4555 RepID=K3Y490_SETIT